MVTALFFAILISLVALVVSIVLLVKNLSEGNGAWAAIFALLALLNGFFFVSNLVTVSGLV